MGIFTRVISFHHCHYALPDLCEHLLCSGVHKGLLKHDGNSRNFMFIFKKKVLKCDFLPYFAVVCSFKSL